MKALRTLLILTAAASICVSCGRVISSDRLSSANQTASISEDEKHRLYSAALNVSESPLDSQIFKKVCSGIGIFDADGEPNKQYMAFVAAHVDWGLKPENREFRRQIDTKEAAVEYINRHLP